MANITEILPDAIYDYADAAAVTRTSESTIRRAIRAKRLRSASVGRRVLIRGAELLRWIDSQTVAGVTDAPPDGERMTISPVRSLFVRGTAQPNNA